MVKPYTTGISISQTHLYARSFQTPFTAELAQALAQEFLALSEDLTVSGCLIDIRGTKSVSSVVEKYNFAYKDTVKIGLPRHWKYAFLKDRDDKSLEFIELVMSNAGYLFRIYNDEREAIDWLETQ